MVQKKSHGNLVFGSIRRRPETLLRHSVLSAQKPTPPAAVSDRPRDRARTSEMDPTRAPCPRRAGPPRSTTRRARRQGASSRPT